MLSADGPQDNIPEKVRPVPPLGVELGDSDKKELLNGLDLLQQSVKQLRQREDPFTVDLLPDVEIFLRAVKQGINYRELFSARDVKNASKVLAEGQQRADALLKGEAPWTSQKGLVVRGFRSRIDRTVQPYGLVIPDSYSDTGKTRYRLDLWFHGRGERSSESVFIAERMSRVGRFAPQDTIVLHPYGRYSNAFKFAGEVDVLEALEHAQRHYKIDQDRVAVRGFSMGVLGVGKWPCTILICFLRRILGQVFLKRLSFFASSKKKLLYLLNLSESYGGCTTVLGMPTICFNYLWLPIAVSWISKNKRPISWKPRLLSEV